MSIAYESAFAATPEHKTAIASSLQRLAVHFKGYFRVRRRSVFAMTQDLIRYDILAQDALRGVIRTVLSGVAQEGLPGEHHFYITFEMEAPGVRVSQRLREKFPEEMTIVLQHQFWDLEVSEHAFTVGLSFNGIPERLVIPFTAVRRFVDPSVEFGLEFSVEDAEVPAEAPEAQAAEDNAPTEEAAAPDGPADVVSLDAFRKKK